MACGALALLAADGGVRQQLLAMDTLFHAVPLPFESHALFVSFCSAWHPTKAHAEVCKTVTSTCPQFPLPQVNFEKAARAAAPDGRLHWACTAARALAARLQ